MDHVEILIKLKDLLRDTCGKRVISSLFQFPLIIDFLCDPKNFNLAVDSFGQDCHSWKILNICIAASDLNLKYSIRKKTDNQIDDEIESHNKSINSQSIEKINSLIEIYPLAGRINALSNRISWSKIFDKMDLESNSFTDPKKKLETIFTVVFEITEDKKGFIDSLVENRAGNAGLKLFSRLLLNNGSFLDFVIHALKTKSCNLLINEFIALLKEMRLLGDQEVQKKLAEEYLEVFPYDEKFQNSINQQGIEDDISKLQYLKNYSELFRTIEKNDAIEQLSHIIRGVLSNLGKELGLITHYEEGDKQTFFASKLNKNDIEITREINRIKEIANTDLDSANTLAFEFSQRLIEKPDLSNQICDWDYGFLIEPENLVQFLIDFGLFLQAQYILTKFLAQWPQNLHLLRIAANLAHDKGDHRYAAEKFALLGLYDELVREEKIKFALSLEYLDFWENALEIRKSINIATDEDFRDIYRCAFYAEKINELSTLISGKEKFIHTSKIRSLLEKIAENDNEMVISMVKNLEASDYSNEKDHYFFGLISDYLKDIGELVAAIEILENCIRFSRFSLPIMNRLISIFQGRGEREKIRSIINSKINLSNEKQKDIETFIDSLIISNEIDRANQTILIFANSWELSPRKIFLKAKILIEKGKYSEAEKILISLVQKEINDNDINLYFCLAVLKCKFENFPLGIGIKNQEKYFEIRQIIKFDEEKKSLFLELLEAELTISNQYERYQQLFNKYSSSSDPEIWRIYAGLGKIYFKLNQFDSAIINFKRAHQIQPKNQFLFWLLIQSYANLNLWNEIETLFNKDEVKDSHSILNNFREFDTLSENSEWPRFLENQIQREPDEIVFRLFLAKYLAGKGKNAEAGEIIKHFYEKLDVNNELYLLCVQILLDIDETRLAERLIEIFLVNKKSPSCSDFLACAFLYEQLGRSEKALAIMNHIDDQDFSLMTFKSKLLKDVGKTEQFNKLLCEIIEKDDQNVNPLDDVKVKIPDYVRLIQENPAQIYLMASTLSIKEKNLEKAISILERGSKNNSDDRKIQFNLLDLLNLTGKSEFIEGLCEKLRESAPEDLPPSLLCLLGEIALSRGEEVKSAQYLSEAMKLTPEDPRIRALQAALIAINGNAQEAKLILNDVIQTIDKANSEKLDHAEETYSVDSRFWLAKAAKNLGNNKKSIEICQQEIHRFGYEQPLIDIFLSALSLELENKFVLQEVKANDNLSLDQEEWLKIFTCITENQSNTHGENDLRDELIIKCKLYLENDPIVLAEAEKLDPDPENINSIIYAVFKSKGLEMAEIAFKSFSTVEKNEIFLAILEKDLNPERSLNHLQKAARSIAPDAIQNALLASIEKNLGNFSDAYAAISLALEQCPNEYEWEIFAGDLCKLNGDLHASISHYQKAQRMNLTQSIDKKIDNLYLSLGTPEAIPILEEQLSKNPNIDLTIQLGKIYIKSGNYRKAVKVFESATKEYPQNSDPYFWLSEIALNLDNPGKALDNIEQAIIWDSSNNQYIRKKAEIINKIEGFSQAISFINDELAKNENIDIQLLKYKVKLVSERDGENAALKVFNSYHSLSEIPEMMLEKACLELRLGNISDSELIAEKLLEYKEVKSDALAILGSISKTKGEFDRAIDFYIKSIESDPFSIEKFIQLSEIYHDRKEFKAAIKTLEDGIRINPGNFDLLYRSSLYYYQQGGYNEAGKFIREAIKIKPDHRESKELLGLLDNVIAVRNYSFVDQIAE